MSEGHITLHGYYRKREYDMTGWMYSYHIVAPVLYEEGKPVAQLAPDALPLPDANGRVHWTCTFLDGGLIHFGPATLPEAMTYASQWMKDNLSSEAPNPLDNEGAGLRHHVRTYMPTYFDVALDVFFKQRAGAPLTPPDLAPPDWQWRLARAIVLGWFIDYARMMNANYLKEYQALKQIIDDLVRL